MTDLSRERIAPPPLANAKRDMGLMAGASALVAGVVELVRMLA